MGAGSVSRRDFLKLSAFWAGSAWVVGFTENSDRQTYTVLTPKEAEIMDTLADCIIPPDEFAGGREAQVTRFIDQQLGDYLHLYKPMYKTCLKALESASKSKYGHPFTGLDEQKQHTYLTDIADGHYDHQPWESHRPSSFFNSMRDHCMMGYYGSPIHGGNKEYVSYQMLGLSIVQEPKRPGKP